MDKRKPLQTGDELLFPGMDCKIEVLMGRGSNAIVYLGTYPDRQLEDLRHQVLIKELFPYHPKGSIYRDMDGTIRCDPDAESLMEMHRVSFLKGNEVHIRLLERYPGDIDANLNTFELHNTLYSVLGYTGGRTMDRELALPEAEKLPLTTHIRRLQGALDVLEAFHSSGLLHLDISPDNLLLIGNGKKERVTLIDYNSVHSLEEIRNGTAIYHSIKEGYTAPEIRTGRPNSIGFSADLYSLTAVFYRCIAGKCLTAAQIVRAAPPELAGVKCLEGESETVRSMVKQILKRGLASLPGRRYQSAEEMRKDLEELQDRIDGKGITHWALWEAGRKDVVRMVKKNPGLNYIGDEDHLYPIAGELEDGRIFRLKDLTNFIVSPEGVSTILLGSGGVGKTTALLRVVYARNAVFGPLEPAMTYIPLYGWKPEEENYIKDRILMGLHFKPETNSLETARHGLLKVLDQPIRTKGGERPRLVILLDGLNEITGDAEMLFREIQELSGMGGVRFLMTSRSEDERLTFRKIRLCPLSQEELTGILSDHGLLQPENPELRQLLQTPMMLSVFIQTAKAGEKQLFIDSQEQLLEYYFAAVCSKAVRGLQDNSPDRWAIEAALYYVLPEIAAYIGKSGTAVSDEQLFPAIEKSYRRLSGRDMRKVFPQWIGHMSDIRGGKTNAEEWYGYIVHDILWRRLGLLVRDEQKRYRVIHQVIEEYLIEIREPAEKKFRCRRNVRAVAFGTAGILLLAGSYRWVYVPFFSNLPAYNADLSENVLDEAVGAYVNTGQLYGKVMDLIGYQEADDWSEYQIWMRVNRWNLEQDNSEKAAQAKGLLEVLTSSGKVMPWSGTGLNMRAYEGLIDTEAEKGAEYLQYIETVETVRQDESLWSWRGKEFLEQFAGLVEKDAYVLGGYYNLVIAPELDAMRESGDEADREKLQYYEELLADTSQYQKEITNEAVGDVDKYISERDEAKHSLLQNGLNYKAEEKQRNA